MCILLGSLLPFCLDRDTKSIVLTNQRAPIQKVSPNSECRPKFRMRIQIWICVPADEPHGSLFVYFRIFAPLADYHVIASHVTSVTRPIPTFSDHLRSFPLICDDFRSFPMIFSNFRWFLPSADISRALQTPIGYHATLRKFYSSVKQLPRTPACWYIKIARPRHFTASARWFGDIAKVMR